MHYSYFDTEFKLKIGDFRKTAPVMSNGENETIRDGFALHDPIGQDGKFSDLNSASSVRAGGAESLCPPESFRYENNVVVYPFVGPETVAVASKRKARRFMGAEISKERYDTAVSQSHKR